METVTEIQFYTVTDVMKMLGIGRTKAYIIISDLNKELRDKGKITIAGKISKKYFEERVLIE